MDVVLKKQWIEALRSGKYQQGRIYLRSSHNNSSKPRHCCLGVLADIKGWEVRQSQSVLRPIQLEAVGLNPENQGNLIRMNDDEDKDFVEIADWIEENL